MGTFRAAWKPIALRVLKESLIPLAGGGAYGVIVATAKQSALDGVSAGGVAFFCLLAAQGLVLRAMRGARDDQPAPEAVKDSVPENAPEPAPEPVPEPAPQPAPKPAPRPADDFVSIRLGIEELKEQGALPEIVPEKPEDGQKGLFRNLIRSPAKRTPVAALAPRQLLDLKMPYQAVLNAAVNFEREVRRRADLPEGRAVPLAQLFLRPQFALSKEKLRELDTLCRVRNGILHGFETLVDPVEATQLVAAFDRAVSWFDPAMDTQSSKPPHRASPPSGGEEHD